MPIDRPDGRHWCAPEREPKHEVFQCPCGNEWKFWHTDNVWRRHNPDDETPESD